MRRIVGTFASACALAALAGAPAVGQDASVNVPFDGLQFQELGAGGPRIATAQGDPQAGPHVSVLILPAGFPGGMHTHTSAYSAVIVQGMVSNTRPNEPDMPMGPGSYVVQAAGEPHITKCLSQEDCILVFTQEGGFDFAPAE